MLRPRLIPSILELKDQTISIRIAGIDAPEVSPTTSRRKLSSVFSLTYLNPRSTLINLNRPVHIPARNSRTPGVDGTLRPTSSSALSGIPRLVTRTPPPARSETGQGAGVEEGPVWQNREYS
jgi:hypothetical protein